MIARWCVVALGLLGAWFPVETRPGSAVALTAGVLLLIPWAWARTSHLSIRRVSLAVTAWVALIIFGLSGGWDRSQGLAEIALAGAVLTMIWLASRARPHPLEITFWAVGIAALSVWGLAQSLGGLEHVRPAVDGLPAHLKVGALARIDQGRAFASLYLPGHLAALLATALPILIARIGRDTVGVVSALAALMAAGGIMATRSPIGGLLALGACAAVMAARRPRTLHTIWMVPVAAAVVAMGLRPDVLRLEPLRLRIDNWGSALWTWLGAPFGSVGLGGFGQASQAVPWEVGNHPVHAHSLPFEWLAELGVVGLAAWFVMVAWLVNVARSLWRSRPELAVALLIVPIHNMLDFSLYTSGVALPWAVLAGWCVALKSPPTVVGRQSNRLRFVPVMAAAGALAVAILNAAGAVFEIAAYQPGTHGVEQAMRAAAMAPWRVGPVEAAGMDVLERPDPNTVEEVSDLVHRRQWQRPRSASRAQLMGRLALLENDPVAAAAHLWWAARIQPHDSRRRQDFEQLVRQMRDASDARR